MRNYQPIQLQRELLQVFSPRILLQKALFIANLPNRIKQSTLLLPILPFVQLQNDILSQAIQLVLLHHPFFIPIRPLYIYKRTFSHD